MSKRVVFNIAPNGNVKMEAEGFVGTSCEDATKVFEEAFSSAGKIDKDHKPEYFQTEQQSESQQNW